MIQTFGAVDLADELRLVPGVDRLDRELAEDLALEGQRDLGAGLQLGCLRVGDGKQDRDGPGPVK